MPYGTAHDIFLVFYQVQQTTLDGIQDQLKRIRVYGVEKVVTYLSYKFERIHGSEVHLFILFASAKLL